MLAVKAKGLEFRSPEPSKCRVNMVTRLYVQSWKAQTGWVRQITRVAKLMSSGFDCETSLQEIKWKRNQGRFLILTLGLHIQAHTCVPTHKNMFTMHAYTHELDSLLVC